MAYALAQRVWNQFCRQSEEVLAQTEPKLTFFPKNHGPTKTGEKNAEAAALAVPETKQPSLPPTAPSTAEAEECKTLEDCENYVYVALKTKEANKAKAKAKSAASVKQKGGMKRPASALSKGPQAADADVSLGGKNPSLTST